MASQSRIMQFFYKVSARDQIECLTSQAWLSKNKQLEQKVAKLSLQTGFLSEYKRMAIFENDHLKKAKESDWNKRSVKKEQSPERCKGPRPAAIIIAVACAASSQGYFKRYIWKCNRIDHLNICTEKWIDSGCPAFFTGLNFVKHAAGAWLCILKWWVCCS